MLLVSILFCVNHTLNLTEIATIRYKVVLRVCACDCLCASLYICYIWVCVNVLCRRVISYAHVCECVHEYVRVRACVCNIYVYVSIRNNILLQMTMVWDVWLTERASNLKQACLKVRTRPGFCYIEASDTWSVLDRVQGENVIIFPFPDHGTSQGMMDSEWNRYQDWNLGCYLWKIEFLR